MSGVTFREVTPGKYWTAHRGRKYLGAIAFHEGRFPAYKAVSDGQPIGEGATLQAVQGLFNHIEGSK